MNKHKKFIKDAYEGNFGEMCNNWKEIIERQYPEFKEKDFKIGEWYTNNNDYLMVWNGGNNTFGFINDEFNDGWSFFAKKGKTLATEKEVKNALIKEAKKRGFKEGVTIISLVDDCLKIIDNRYNTKDFQYFKDGNSLYLNGYKIFIKGEWAKIVSEPPKKMTVAEISKKLGYKIEIIE